MGEKRKYAKVVVCCVVSVSIGWRFKELKEVSDDLNVELGTCFTIGCTTAFWLVGGPYTTTTCCGTIGGGWRLQAKKERANADLHAEKVIFRSCPAPPLLQNSLTNTVT
jgi:hypothetical protein